MVPEEGQSEKEKSLVDWVSYSVAIAFVLPFLLAAVFFFRYEGAWSMWLSLFLSRGIYIVLATLIFSCFIINFFKNKVQRNQVQPGIPEDSWCNTGNFWKAPFLPSSGELTLRNSLSVEEACGSDKAKQMLREADARNEALKRELEELNKTRLALEERSGMLEREKAKVEESLEEAKFQSALENEGLRKEAAVAQRQLQQLIEVSDEKEMLSREISSASRETRIAESALKDQARLATRLEEAREELNRLKLQMEDVKKERDTAVAIAADLAVRAHGAADDSAQLIGQWVKREMETRKKKDQLSTIASVASESRPEIIDSDVHHENVENEKVESSLEIAGSSGLTETETEKPPTPYIDKEDELNESNFHLDTSMDGVTVINWDDEDPEASLQEIGCGPVTSSRQFRDFLTTHYS